MYTPLSWLLYVLLTVSQRILYSLACSGLEETSRLPHCCAGRMFLLLRCLVTCAHLDFKRMSYLTSHDVSEHTWQHTNPMRKATGFFLEHLTLLLPIRLLRCL
jgi:hypothetical protein